VLQIHSQSTKQDILLHLASVSKVNGDLIIEVLEIPQFITSKPAFHIFKFQLQNYPRPIKWSSKSEDVVQFLLDCNADIFTHPATLTLNNVNKKLVKFKEKIGIKDTPKRVAQQSENFQETIQNLDSWVEKIEDTKKALLQLKQQNQIQAQLTQKSIVPIRPNLWESIKIFINSHKMAKILTVAIAGVLGIVLIAVLFPTKVYTLEVRPLLFEESKTLSISLDQFTKTQVTLEAASTIRATGIGDSNNRPIGRAFLINGGSEDVQLTNGSFQLTNPETGAKYIHVKDSTQPDTFVIPAGNASVGNRLEITIAAEQKTDVYDLPINSQLEITNLLDQRACLICNAVTSSPIRQSDSVGQRVVTTADQALLRNKVDTIIAEKRVLEIKKFQEQKMLTNPNWFKNITSDYKFTNDIGSQADDFGLNERVSMDLYSLAESNVIEAIKKSNSEVKNITDLVVVSSDTNVSALMDKKREEQVLNIKFFYTFAKEDIIDKNTITKTLSQQQFEDARNDIKKRYPSVRDIQEQRTGLQIPGIPSRVDLKVNE
jgi:hypothetical protein